jgi:hypothetical protein
MSGDRRHDRPDEPTRDYLKSALEHMLAAGRSVSDMVEFSLERFGDRVIPDVQAFLHQVQRGEIKVKGLSRSAREALFGMKLTPEERATLIREAAYRKAERRGFSGGSPEQDWLEAEREVDALIAREVGLVPRGREAFAELGGAVERELGDLGRQVSDWLAGRRGRGADAGSVSEARPAATSEAPAEGPPEGKPARKAAAGRKEEVKKKVAKKKAAKKKAAKKKVAEKKAAGKGEAPAKKQTGKSRKK